MQIDKKTLASMIDHTMLKPDATRHAIIQCCNEAIENRFASVCINPCHVELAYSLLKGTDVKVCTVAGFPLGAGTTASKAAEVQKAVESGASEVDMVINIGALKEGSISFVENEIKEVVNASNGALVKAIIETCYLTREEIITACKSVKNSGAAFVKTSTGFGTKGASVEDVKLIRTVVGDKFGVKASGGIRTLAGALAMIEAGANRLGLSASLSVLKEFSDY
jgi:deoxyribose-phosphate aldolase